MKSEVYDFLKSCETYYLATVDGDQPKVRPFGTIDMFEEKLYIQTGKVKKVSKEMKENPKIEICAFNGTSWIRLEAKAYLDERREEEPPAGSMWKKAKKSSLSTAWPVR